MLRALDLVDVGPAPKLHLELGSRLNVMTGDNGLGKSFVLDVIWWALSGTWAGLPAWPRAGAAKPQIAIEIDEELAGRMIDLKRPQSDLSVESGRVRRWSDFEFALQQWTPRSFAFTDSPLPSIVLYARADGGFALWDPARNHYKLRPGPVWGEIASGTFTNPATLRRPPAYIFQGDEVLNGKELDGKIICNGLIRDWVNWQQKRPDTTGGQAFEHLRRMLEELSPNPDKSECIRPGPPRRLFVDDTREFPTMDTGYGEVPIIHASAGMRRIVSLAYLIVWCWHEHLEASRLLQQEPVSHLVFLMDEVENHLHPEWQRRIFPALLKVLEGLAPAMTVQAHLTTHAPLVLASLESHFDPERDKLFLFDLEGGSAALNEVPWARQGDASRWLTSPAFNLHRARSIEAEKAIDDASAFMRGEEPKHFKTREEIERALQDALPGQDPFWPRWLAFTGETAA